MPFRFPPFRVSLRLFLLLSALLGVGGGLLIRAHVRELAAEKALMRRGFKLFFDERPSARFVYGDEQRLAENWREGLFERTQHVKTVNGARAGEIGQEPIDDAALQPLRDLRHVEVLVLFSQPITADGVNHFRHLHSLRWLDLSATKITDAGLSKLAHLSQLQTLRLWGCPISSDGLKHLARFEQLEELDISYVSIHSADLRHLTRLKKLRTLDLSATKIDDSAAQYIAQLTSLETLLVENTQVGDPFLREVGSLKKLTMLQMKGTKVTPEMRGAFPNLRFPD